MLSVVVASDKFKGSLSSAGVAAAVADGLRRERPDVVVRSVVVADGGDGTLAAAVAAGFELVPVVASGPTGEPVRSGFARRGEVAVVELADVCGLVRLPDGVPAAMSASSRGAGEVMAAAIDAGCTRVILGIGGSASTDGGAGLVRALGARVLDSRGEEVAEGGAGLVVAQALELTAVRARLAGVEVVVACDVDNPLTGPSGAAATYGPQKGAGAAEVAGLDAALTHWAGLVARETARDLREVPGAGAAGGVGFAALAVLGAELRPGIELVLELVGLRQELRGADLLVTGEGKLDEQTLRGKAVAGVAAAGVAAGVPVVAVCGVNTLEAGQLRAAGVEKAYALTELEPDVRRCVADPVPLLRMLGERIAADLR
ncbi:glycerate kinase [Kribbella sp. CA-293567]|uniref:glycerate kinase n=1 Tax=Kribbella sp. CA-293567 TaxID=3002436 RepID=UPI0022DDCBEE|nr:glycerate kinase [Kribbella sp. CA-293567]WBQ07975.1 glycerate kinase [Kribbella sp. CA-293567]